MITKIACPGLVLLTLFGCIGGALAQSAGPDEAVRPNGGVSQELALTPEQKSAIYNAVIRQGGRTDAFAVPVTVGAPVPASIDLRGLPDQAVAENPWTDLLKYATVENLVVVIDPIRMRVVDIIHNGVNP